MEELRRLSLELYGFAAGHAERNGIILADTKFEFGRDSSGRIVLADEVLTPDSSRFWPSDRYEPGRSQPSFDKQYVRDWLDESGWDHTPPGPELPAEVVAGHARQVRRGLRADRGTAVRRVARPLRFRVLIRPKEGILDPQGQAVERALPALGYEGVSNVHVGPPGRARRPWATATWPARVAEMCERLLANPLIESYEVEALGDG